MSVQHKVTVELGERAYEIIIGSGVLARAATHIAPLLLRPKLAIVADANLAENHLPVLRAALNDVGITHDSYLVPSGESSKNFQQLGDLCDWLLAKKIERNDCIIAVGGGVIGDLTGFAAANIYFQRGVVIYRRSDLHQFGQFRLDILAFQQWPFIRLFVDAAHQFVKRHI